MQICARQHWWSRSERVDAHPSCVLVSRQETRIYQSVKRLVVSELRGGKENRWRKWKIERIRSKERGRKTPLFCAWTLLELRLKRDSVSIDNKLSKCRALGRYILIRESRFTLRSFHRSSWRANRGPRASRIATRN